MLIEARKLHAQVNYGINQNHPTSINVDTIPHTLGQIRRIRGLVLISKSVSIDEVRLNAYPMMYSASNSIKRNDFHQLTPLSNLNCEYFSIF